MLDRQRSGAGSLEAGLLHHVPFPLPARPFRLVATLGDAGPRLRAAMDRPQRSV